MGDLIYIVAYWSASGLWCCRLGENESLRSFLFDTVPELYGTLQSWPPSLPADKFWGWLDNRPGWTEMSESEGCKIVRRAGERQ